MSSLANLLSGSGSDAADLLQKTQESFSRIVSSLHAPQKTTPVAQSVTTSGTGTDAGTISHQHPALRAYRDSAAA